MAGALEARTCSGLPHAYWSGGTYTVTLTAGNVCGSDQATATIVARRYVYLPLVLRGYS